MARLLLRCLFALPLAALAAENAAPRPAAPNIVFIISDDHAWTDYGHMGHKVIETPHLDRFAARSAVFERGYVPTALCRPALATFATGLYAHQHRVSGNDPAFLPEMLPTPADGGRKAAKKAGGEPAAYQRLREQLISHLDRIPTLPRLLGERGYLSHQSGKWWEGGYRRGGFTHGMTRGFPQPGGRHGDDGLRIGREGMDPIFNFIDEATAARKPFFLWYAPFLPHTPHTPPDRLFQKYRPRAWLPITSPGTTRWWSGSTRPAANSSTVLRRRG